VCEETNASEITCPLVKTQMEFSIFRSSEKMDTTDEISTERKIVSEKRPMKRKRNLAFELIGVGLGLATFSLFSTKPPVKKRRSRKSSYDAVDSFVKEQMRRLHIPGASLAIVEGDQIVHIRGFGLARPAGEVPTSQTPFFIGSITKSFTALAVMQLVEAGKIGLDAPVQHYLPWFRVADPEASACMTVRHLLNQTSGLPTIAGEVMQDDYGGGADATERKVRALSTLKTNRLGQKVAYSNLNYDILGLIIEVISGETYADYVQNHIFNPLGMAHSYTSKVAAKQNGLAMGHRHWFSFPFPAPDLPFPRASLPSGYLISTAEDMANYLIAHINGGQFANTKILSKAGMDELHRGAVEYIVFGEPFGSYAMGWFDEKVGGTRIISHGGNVPDFSAFMGFIPGKKRGLVLLLNADPYGLPPITGEIGLNTILVLDGQQPAPIKLDYIQWIMRLLPLIPIIQISGFLATIRRIRKWQNVPSSLPSAGHLWSQHILLPLIPNLTLAAALGYLKASGLIRYLHLFNPDLAWIAQVCGGFAGVWAIVRTGLMIWAPRKTR
jgi:CubicO group peptidase (beta-lactamase class C family)